MAEAITTGTAWNEATRPAERTPGARIDLLAWAERFIATPSVSRDGTCRIAELAAQLAVEAGLAPELEERWIDGTAQFTLRAERGPAVGEGLLLLTHLDTAAPGDPAAWSATGGDPFAPTCSLDRLYGLGSADAKVDLVCKLAAVASLDPARLTRPLRVVGTYGGKAGLLGVRDWVAGGGAAGMRYALVGGPSELVAIRAHKGLLLYEAELELGPVATPPAGVALRETLRGVSAPASTPQLGSSAIEAALERLAQPDVAALYALAGGEASHEVADLCSVDFAAAEPPRAGGLRYTPAPGAAALDCAPLIAFYRAWKALLAELRRERSRDFEPDHSVGNLGLVRSRGRRVTLTFELRPIPGVDLEPALAGLAAYARLRRVRESPPLATSPGSPLVAAVTAAQQEVGLPVRVGTEGSCSEAGVLARAGLDAVVIGAGPAAGGASRPNEYTRISELALARDLYRRVIQQLCTGEPPCSC